MKSKAIRVKSPVFRANWVSVFQPKQGSNPSRDPEYRLTMIFGKDADLSGIKAAIEEAAASRWGADPKKWPKLKSRSLKPAEAALRTRDDGTEFLPEGYEEGGHYIEAHSKEKPQVVNQKVEFITEESNEFYSGCYAWAWLTFKAYDFDGNRGITCYLGNIQKVRDGESLAGRTSAEQDFVPIDDNSEDTFSAPQQSEVTTKNPLGF